jgi:hypothetical protein
MQPNFSDDSAHYARRLPDGHPERNNPFRMLIGEVGYVPGADLLFGSDGMPHGFRAGLRQALFPPHAGQRLTEAEFVAGYCMPDEVAGHIEVQIDPDERSVSGRVVLGDGGPHLAGPGAQPDAARGPRGDASSTTPACLNRPPMVSGAAAGGAGGVVTMSI